MIRKICNILVTLLFIAILAAAGILVVPRLMGYQVYAVLTASMEPSYPIGSVIMVQPATPADIQVGDAMTFSAGNFEALVTHRVIEIDAENRQFITKGDNNDNMDFAPVPFDNVVGKVAFSVPILGYISLYIKSAKGILAAGGLIIIILLLFIIPEIFKKEPEQEQQAKEPK